MEYEKSYIGLFIKSLKKSEIVEFKWTDAEVFVGRSQH